MRDAKGRTHTYIWNPTKKKYVHVKDIYTSDAKSASKPDTQYYVFLVLLDADYQGDETLYTIGHESLIHVDKNAKDLDQAFIDYKSGKMDGTSPETVLAVALRKIEGDGSDHKLFVDSKAVKMEAFVQELGKLYNTTKFSEMMKEDKKTSH